MIGAVMVATLGLAPLDISTGRQLFVDDYLIARTNGVVRHWNTPQKFGDGPLIAPIAKDGTRIAGCVAATDGGLWWDPTVRKFRLWYETDWCGDLRYAESSDGLRWTFPKLDVVPGTNLLLPDVRMDSWSVFPDYKADNPYSAWCLYTSEPGGMTADRLHVSADGIHFKTLGIGGSSGDRSSAYYDPFRGKWVFSLRDYWKGRSRRRFDKDDFTPDGLKWRCSGDLKPGEVRAEQWTELPNGPLYNFTAVPYESLMLGAMEIHVSPKKGPNGESDNAACDYVGLPKHTHIQFSFSRNGREYVRGGNACSIMPSEWGSGKWDTGYLAVAGGVCVIRDERLWFYYTGFRGDGERRTGTGYEDDRKGHCIGTYYNGSIGAATLRRDGFAGMVADGNGSLTTKPLVFAGKRLFVNAECRFGELAAEILDADGKPVPGFAAADCRGLKFVDTTKRELVFAGGDLGALAGKPVLIRFNLHCATLYSFWVSPTEKGTSGGYVAAGGPAYPGLMDR